MMRVCLAPACARVPAGTLAIALAFAAVIAVLPAEASAQSGANIRSPRYAVRIEVLPDGSLDVIESVTLAVGATPITSFDRNIPRRRTDGFTNVVALMDGRAVPVSIDARKDLNIRWEFSPTANATHTFEMRYRAVHVLAREIDGPRLVWTALPRRHAYPIDASEITLFAPTGAVATSVDAPGGDVRPGSPANPGVVIAGTALTGERTVTVDITFAPNSIKPVEPQWFIRQELQLDMQPAWIAGAASLLAVGVGILVMAFAQLPRHRAPELKFRPARETVGPNVSSGMVPVARERIEAERRRTRSWLLVTGLVLIVSGVIGAGAVAALMERFGPVPLAIPAAVFLIGLVYVVVGGRMSTRGDSGGAE